MPENVRIRQHTLMHLYSYIIPSVPVALRCQNTPDERTFDIARTVDSTSSASMDPRHARLSSASYAVGYRSSSYELLEIAEFINGLDRVVP